MDYKQALHFLVSGTKNKYKRMRAIHVIELAVLQISERGDPDQELYIWLDLGGDFDKQDTPESIAKIWDSQ